MFRPFLRPISAPHKCTLSFMYCQPILLQVGIVDEMEHLIHDTKLQQYWFYNFKVNMTDYPSFNYSSVIIFILLRFSWVLSFHWMILSHFPWIVVDDVSVLRRLICLVTGLLSNLIPHAWQKTEYLYAVISLTYTATFAKSICINLKFISQFAQFYQPF